MKLVFLPTSDTEQNLFILEVWLKNKKKQQRESFKVIYYKSVKNEGMFSVIQETFVNYKKKYLRRMILVSHKGRHQICI